MPRNFVEPTFGRMLTAVLMAMAAAGLVPATAFLSVATVRTGDVWFLFAIPLAVARPRHRRARGP